VFLSWFEIFSLRLGLVHIEEDSCFGLEDWNLSWRLLLC
jgi:hypothetical protein